MIGLPKTHTEFSKYKDFALLRKEWTEELKGQAELYLRNDHFFSQKTETWRYFPFRKIKDRDFIFNPAPQTSFTKKILPCFSSSLVISIKNGQISSLLEDNKDVLICSWADFLSGRVRLPLNIEDKIRFTLKQKRNPFCYLSNAFYPSGWILIIKKTLKEPLEIHYTHSESQKLQGLNLRNFIFLEPESSAQIVEVFYGRVEKSPLFLNVQTDCFLDEHSVLEHSRLDQTGEEDIMVNQIFSELSAKSKACFFSLSLNAGVSRFGTELNQYDQSVSETRGLSLLNAFQYTDHKVSVFHHRPGGVSRQFYKSFLFESARQIFQGLISIDKKAPGSDTAQFSKSFLFGKKAFSVALPELNILNDDVKASHGAVIAPFRDNRHILFYLQSRSLDSFTSAYLILFALIKDQMSCLGSNTQKALNPFIDRKIKSLERLFTEVVR